MGNGSERVPHYFPPLIGPSDAEVAEALATIEQRRLATEQQSRGVLVQCSSNVARGRGCGALTHVRDLTYIQTHWYTQPHGCTEGDYWNSGEGMFECPECGHMNRLYDSPDIVKLKRAFKCVEDRHDG